ncbi:hypothetical protein HZC33_03645 [Candidatus Wolfebacteria bacterium]|nr:hypothetical protein [Candidatus Wolfebacteria bacterium]
MLIFLYGPDSYRKRQKIKELVGDYQKKHPFLAVESFDLEEESEVFSKLNNFFSSLTLFENIKLAVAENILNAVKDNKRESKKIIKLFKDNLENKNFVSIICEDKNPIKEFSFLLEKPVLSQEFENLTGSQLEQFIKKEAKSRNLEIDDKMIVSMVKIFKGNIWGLINELDKLFLFGKKISVKDFDEIIDYKEQNADFFRQVSNFAFSRSLPQKIVNLEVLLETEDPAKIFNFLASFSSNSLDLTRKFADYDVSIKSGKMDYEEALVEMALS